MFTVAAHLAVPYKLAVNLSHSNKELVKVISPQDMAGSVTENGKWFIMTKRRLRE